MTYLIMFEHDESEGYVCCFELSLADAQRYQMASGAGF
jgi:hypothetical protein